ncbi:MAG TPA: hypothetical protein VH482_31855 [Thermomicrobiales bacterium]|jgi:hypothetical protein
MTERTATTTPDTSDQNGTEPADGAAPAFVAKTDTTKSPIEANELLRADAGDVQATTVTMDRSGAESVTAQRVTMERSGAKTLEARSAQLVNSGVAILKSEQAVLQGGSAVLVSAKEARLVKSRAAVVVAERLTGEGELKALLHVGSSDGCIRPVLDGRSALGLGAAFGLVVLVFGRLVKRLGGRWAEASAR